MNKQLKNRIHLIYGIVLSITAVVAGIGFILAAYHIYQAGLAADTQPYTYATIAAAFAKIAIPTYLCLALVVGGILLNIVLPPEKKKAAPEKNRALILQRLQAKTDMDSCPQDLLASIAKLERSRKLHTAISAVLLVIASALFLSYACDGDNWANAAGDATALNPCMVRAVFAMAICLIPPFLYCVFTSFFCRRSLDQQIELMRKASAAAPRKAPKADPPAAKELWICITRYTVLAIAVGLMLFGLFTGGTEDVLAKAAAICTECVGLG